MFALTRAVVDPLIRKCALGLLLMIGFAAFGTSLTADDDRELFEYNRRAWAAIVKENYAAAEQIIRDGLRKVPRDEPPTEGLAELQLDLARVLMMQHRFAESETAIQLANQTAIAAKGENSAVHLRVLSQLALLKDQQEKPEESEQILRRVLAAEEKAHGLHSPEVVSTLRSLAFRLRDREKFDESEALLLRVLAIQQNARIPKRKEIALTINELGLLYNKQKRYRDYEILLVEFIEYLSKQKPRPGDSQLAETLQDLGELFVQEQRWDDAEQHYQQAIDLMEEDEFHDEETLDRIKFSLARLHIQRQKYSQANTELSELIRRATQRRPQDEFRLQWMCEELGELSLVRQDFEQAETAYRASLDYFSRHFKTQKGPRWGAKSERLSVVLAINGKSKESNEWLNQFVADCEANKPKTIPDRDRKLFQEIRAEADQLAARRQYFSAEERYRRAFSGCVFLNGFQTSLSAELQERIAAMLNAQGRQAEAKVYSDRAASIRRTQLPERTATRAKSVR